MRTPIADFVREYANKSGCRFHMPGHKGRAFLGCEAFDITEADVDLMKHKKIQEKGTYKSGAYLMCVEG